MSIDDLLRLFGAKKSSLIGAGAEAQVFALNAQTVLRVSRQGSQKADVLARIHLLSKMALGAKEVRFEIPSVKDFGFKFGFHYTVENRLSGYPLSDALQQEAGMKRVNLVNDYLETSLQLHKLLIGETMFGEVGLGDPIRSLDLKDFLRRRAQKSLGVRRLSVDLDSFLDAITESKQPQLVHLDYCPSNVMCSEGKIVGVLDFGGTTIAGGSVFNPIVATAFLDPAITPVATEHDHLQATDWLATLGPSDGNLAMKKWLAAYWSFCGKDEDIPLFKWCRRILSA